MRFGFWFWYFFFFGSWSSFLCYYYYYYFFFLVLDHSFYVNLIFILSIFIYINYLRCVFCVLVLDLDNVEFSLLWILEYFGLWHDFLFFLSFYLFIIFFYFFCVLSGFVSLMCCFWDIVSVRFGLEFFFNLFFSFIWFINYSRYISCILVFKERKFGFQCLFFFGLLTVFFQFINFLDTFFVFWISERESLDFDFLFLFGFEQFCWFLDLWSICFSFFYFFLQFMCFG